PRINPPKLTCSTNFPTTRRTLSPHPARKFCTPTFCHLPPKPNSSYGSATPLTHAPVARASDRRLRLLLLMYGRSTLRPSLAWSPRARASRPPTILLSP